MKYAFIRNHEAEHSVRRMCRLLDLHPSGYYAWCKTPECGRAIDDRRLLGHIRHAWLESGGVYGYRKVCDDMRDLGESCGANRLMRTEGLRAQRGYGRRPGKHGGKPAAVAPNHLQREFSVPQPNRVWVTDITYIRTHEGMVVPGGGLGSVLSADRWLVHATEDRSRVGPERTADGCLASPADQRGDGALRPGQPVRQL